MGNSNPENIEDHLREFYKEYCEDDIVDLVKNYPRQRSLQINYEDLESYNRDLAADFLDSPLQIRDSAEESLRNYVANTEGELGDAHVRLYNLPDVYRLTGTRMSDNLVGRLIAVDGYVHSSEGVNPKLTEGAFECQRCGTLTYIPQTGPDTDEPSKCQGCERDGPFRVNYERSEFVDAQQVVFQEDPRSTQAGESPAKVPITLVDDLAGSVSAGDAIRLNGTLKLAEDEDADADGFQLSYNIEPMSVESRDGSLTSTHEETADHTIDMETFTKVAPAALVGLTGEVREEETKAKLITPFIAALGWNKFDNTEVRLEHTDGKTSLRPDYALFGDESDTPDIIVEAKQLNTDLTQHEDQLYNYVRLFEAEWGVLTNGEDYFVYRSSTDDDMPEKVAEMELGDIADANIVQNLQRENYRAD